MELQLFRKIINFYKRGSVPYFSYLHSATNSEINMVKKTKVELIFLIRDKKIVTSLSNNNYKLEKCFLFFSTFWWFKSAAHCFHLSFLMWVVEIHREVLMLALKFLQTIKSFKKSCRCFTTSPARLDHFVKYAFYSLPVWARRLFVV